MISVRPRHVPTFGALRIVLDAARTVRGWLRTRAERRSLLSLDDSLLKDIGLTRGDVERVTGQPFRVAIDYAELEVCRRHGGPRLGGPWR